MSPNFFKIKEILVIGLITVLLLVFLIFLMRHQEKDSKSRFRGSDQLTGLEKLYHEILVKNHWVDNDAYGVRFAGGGSGISFGADKKDMKKNLNHRKNFVDILQNARDDKGNPFFTEKEIESIAGEEERGYQKFSNGGPVGKFFGSYRSRVNAALSSSYGRQKIDGLYVKEITEIANFINKMVNEKIQPPNVKKFCSTDYGKALLFDYHYHNQILILRK